MKLAPTVFACRQLINHGHVMVNGSRCNIPSRMINVGSYFLKDKAKNIPAVIEQQLYLKEMYLNMSKLITLSSLDLY